jgi:hypothetical protein
MGTRSIAGLVRGQAINVGDLIQRVKKMFLLDFTPTTTLHYELLGCDR